MANTQHIYLFLFFLALAACLEIQFAEGPKLKAMNKHKVSPAEVETGPQNQAKPAVNFGQSQGNHKDNGGVHGRKIISPPMTPTTQSDEFGSSDASHRDAFKTQHQQIVLESVIVLQRKTFRATKCAGSHLCCRENRWRSTHTPGHSPGVGHSF